MKEWPFRIPRSLSESKQTILNEKGKVWNFEIKRMRNTWWPSLTRSLDKKTPMNLVPPIIRIFFELEAETCNAPFGCETLLLYCKNQHMGNHVKHWNWGKLRWEKERKSTWIWEWSSLVPLKSEREEGGRREKEGCLCTATNFAMITNQATFFFLLGFGSLFFGLKFLKYPFLSSSSLAFQHSVWIRHYDTTHSTAPHLLQPLKPL